MSIEGQGHFFTIYFPGFVCVVLYKATISAEHLQNHWSSGLFLERAAHSVKSVVCHFVMFMFPILVSRAGPWF